MTDLEARAKARGWPVAAGHALNLNTVRRHGEAGFVAICSCGRYRSTRRFYLGHAVAAGQAHVDAKAATQ